MRRYVGLNIFCAVLTLVFPALLLLRKALGRAAPPLPGQNLALSSQFSVSGWPA